jgi:DNA replication protein DnaC
MSPATTASARPPASPQARPPAPPQARTTRERSIAPGIDPVDAAIENAARALHLPTIREGYDEAVDYALRERSTYKQFLADLLGGEVAHRDERRKLRLVREANFSRPKRIEDFDYHANPNISPEQVNTLCDPAWVVAGQPLCLIGDSGTGKSHLLIGIGTAIAEAGMKVRYTTAANLVNELSEAADDRQLTKVIARYGRCDLLCLDEFGYLDLDKAGAKLLFQIFTDREERRAIAVASNAPFSEWKKTFTDPRLCAAIVDRLTYNAHIIETGEDSYRLLSATRNGRTD